LALLLEASLAQPNYTFALSKTVIVLLLVLDGALALTSKLRACVVLPNSADDVNEATVVSLLAPSGALALVSRDKRGLAL